MKNFRDLEVWKRAHSLTLEVYRATENFPKHELYGITSQMRRASSSIAANIAEGCGKKTDADFARYLQNAFGSASELEYFFLLSLDLDLIDTPMYEKLQAEVTEVKKMLASFIQALHADR